MNKFNTSLFTLIIASMTCTGCQTITKMLTPTSSAPYTPYNYTGDQQLWPAVFDSTLKWASDCKELDINILADVYEFSKCPAKGSDRIRYNTLIRREGTTLTMDMAPEHYDSEAQEWRAGMPLLATGDIEGFKAQTMSEIEAVMSNSQSYEASRAKYYEDFYFHVYVMGFMTDVAKKEWVATLKQEATVFEIELGLAEFQESPQENYAYEAWLALPGKSPLGFTFSGTKVRYYTNDKSMAYNKIGDRVSITGSFVEYQEDFSTFLLSDVSSD